MTNQTFLRQKHFTGPTLCALTGTDERSCSKMEKSRRGKLDAAYQRVAESKTDVDAPLRCANTGHVKALTNLKSDEDVNERKPAGWLARPSG